MSAVPTLRRASEVAHCTCGGLIYFYAVYVTDLPRFTPGDGFGASLDGVTRWLSLSRRALYLQSNQFSSSIPSTLGSLTALQ
jgi:hypothetical protein